MHRYASLTQSNGLCQLKRTNILKGFLCNLHLITAPNFYQKWSKKGSHHSVMIPAGEESSLPICCKNPDLQELHSNTLCRCVILISLFACQRN